MAITLDPALEKRIQQQMEHGSFAGPQDLLSYALNLVEQEAQAGDFLLRNRDVINAMLDESCAEEARGEGYSPEEAVAILESRRVARAGRAA